VKVAYFALRALVRAAASVAVLTLVLVLGGPAARVAAADGPIKALPSPYTPDFSGKASVHCYCVASVSGCSSSFFWQAAGAPTHDWWQENFVTQGTPVDLAAACYRKAEEPSLGDGLCCAVDQKNGAPDATMLHHFFGAAEITPAGS
jgi:hypothetical protein